MQGYGVLLLFFFFQAEDGIRDYKVTGVQTCALPILWQKGLVTFGDFFLLFVPSVVNFILPAAIMHFAVPRGRPAPQVEPVALKIGARRIALFFALTIITAIAVHSALHLPPCIGMMTGPAHLQAP